MPEESPPNIIGDPGFIGVNSRVNPGQLPEGFLADASNVRIRDGQICSRGDDYAKVQFNRYQFFDGFEYVGVNGTTVIVGSGVFSDPQGHEWLLVGYGQYDISVFTVYLYNDSYGYRTVSMPDLELDSQTEGVGAINQFVQCYNQVVALRGFGKDPLVWSGVDGESFVPVSANAPDPERPTYLLPTPPSAMGVFMADRLWVVTDRDTVEWSDIYDVTRFDRSLNSAKINTGTSDFITALVPFQGNRLLIFKNRSIDYLDNVTGDLANMRADTLTNSVGCVARRTVQQIGGDIFWLGEGGIYSLRQTWQGDLRTPPRPVSYAVQPWFDRINWPYAHKAFAQIDQRQHLYLLFVPVDGSTEVNRVYVYHYLDNNGTDVTQGHWQSRDTLDPGFGTPYDCHLTESNGRRSPIVIAEDENFLYDWGYHGDSTWALPSILTRGYAGLPETVEVSLQSQYMIMGAQLWRDGVSEQEDLKGLTVVREKYRQWNKPDFVTTNTNSDWADANREDYTILPGDNCQPKTGSLRVEVFQDLRHVMNIGSQEGSKWAQIFLYLSRGRWKIQSIAGVQRKKAFVKKTRF